MEEGLVENGIIKEESDLEGFVPDENDPLETIYLKEEPPDMEVNEFAKEECDTDILSTNQEFLNPIELEEEREVKGIVSCPKDGGRSKWKNGTVDNPFKNASSFGLSGGSSEMGSSSPAEPYEGGSFPLEDSSPVSTEFASASGPLSVGSKTLTTGFIVSSFSAESSATKASAVKRRKRNQKNYCPYCFKYLGKMTRHLEFQHPSEKMVLRALSFPKGSVGRRKIWLSLKAEGNRKHSKFVNESLEGELFPSIDAIKRENYALCESTLEEGLVGNLGNEDGSGTPPSQVLLSSSSADNITIANLSTRRKNYCPYCSRYLVKLARHLESKHPSEPKVLLALSYPKGSEERSKAWSALKAEGNMKHNISVKESKEGELLPAVRSKTSSNERKYVMCNGCKNLFVKKLLHKHMKLCKRVDTKAVTSRRYIGHCLAAESIFKERLDKGFLNSVVSPMNDDHINSCIRRDLLILKLGESIYAAVSKSPSHKYVRHRMRQLAKLLLVLRKKDEAIVELADAIDPQKFWVVVDGVKECGGFDGVGAYKVSSFPLKLGYSLKKVACILRGIYEEEGKECLIPKCERFLCRMDREWADQVPKTVI